ncbi:hypothetical protein Ancab_037744 [Ancistrocladus abbreviatus]
MAARGSYRPPVPVPSDTNLHPHDHNHNQPCEQNTTKIAGHSASNRGIVVKPTPRRLRRSFTMISNSKTSADPNTNTKTHTNDANTEAAHHEQSLKEQGDGEMAKRRRRPGRPRGSRNKPKPPIIITCDTPPNMLTSHVIEVMDGWDIMESIADFARRQHRGVSILGGSGCVTNVTLRQPLAPTETVSALQGRFGILFLSGTFLPPPFPPATSTLTVFLSGGEGEVVGGVVAGMLLASGPVAIVAASFCNVAFEKLPLEEGAGEGEEKVGLMVPTGVGSCGSNVGSGMGSSLLQDRVDGLQIQQQPQARRQEEVQTQALGGRSNNNAASDDLREELPSNMLTTGQLSPNQDMAYWAGTGAGAGAVAGHFAM